MKRNTNWRAMQVPPHREPGKPPEWRAPGDTNTKAMSMGSWKARANQSGAKAK